MLKMCSKLKEAREVVDKGAAILGVCLGPGDEALRELFQMKDALKLAFAVS
jgi:hypothetical protein